MTTERKLHKVWFFPAIWDGQLIRNRDQAIPYIVGYDEIPQWLRERAAVLRLLEEGEETPLGMWSGSETFISFEDSYWIVRQPGDPKWGEW